MRSDCRNIKDIKLLVFKLDMERKLVCKITYKNYKSLFIMYYEFVTFKGRTVLTSVDEFLKLFM